MARIFARAYVPSTPGVVPAGVLRLDRYATSRVDCITEGNAGNF